MSRLQDIVIAALERDATEDSSCTLISSCRSSCRGSGSPKRQRRSKRNTPCWRPNGQRTRPCSNRGFGIYACYRKESEYLIVKTAAPADDPTFPSLTKKFVPAYRFERQMKSLMGVTPVGHPGPAALDKARGLA